MKTLKTTLVHKTTLPNWKKIKKQLLLETTWLRWTIVWIKNGKLLTKDTILSLP
jgi:hypothetical protein